MEEGKIQALKAALWESDPWKMVSEFEFVCLHCGSKYNGGVAHETHKQNCIWLVNYQEVEGGLTKDAADSCKACGGENDLHEDDCPVAAEMVHQSAIRNPQAHSQAQNRRERKAKYVALQKKGKPARFHEIPTNEKRVGRV